jgi:hypothetical protein
MRRRMLADSLSLVAVLVAMTPGKAIAGPAYRSGGFTFSRAIAWSNVSNSPRFAGFTM